MKPRYWEMEFWVIFLKLWLIGFSNKIKDFICSHLKFLNKKKFLSYQLPSGKKNSSTTLICCIHFNIQSTTFFFYQTFSNSTKETERRRADIVNWRFLKVIKIKTETQRLKWHRNIINETWIKNAEDNINKWNSERKVKLQ